MAEFSNSQIFNGILGQDVAALKHLYSDFYPKVLSMIKGYGGQEADANDIFQEALIIFLRKAKNKELDDSVLVQPYLMITCKHFWFKCFNEASKHRKEELPMDLSGEDVLFQEYINSRKRELMYKHFKRLRADCRKVIKSFYNGLSYQEIAEKYGYSSDEYAKRKKYLCKNFLIKSIKSDPLYKEIFEMDESYFLEKNRLLH